MPALLALLYTTLGAASAHAQAGAHYAVQLSATTQDDPPAIILQWPESAQALNDYTVYRRDPASPEWGDPIADASAIAWTENNRRRFIDHSIEPGRAYEYKGVRKLNVYTPTGQNHQAFGYIVAGIRAPLVEHRGTLVLVVERSLLDPLAHELTRLENDLTGDGWNVVRRDVAREDSVAQVKAQIKAVYDADPHGVKAVFLFGRIPVPYSGNFQPRPPDGHATPGDDHRGAWPADVYYADMDGEWTDHIEYYINGTNQRGTNVPGDGKFDPTYLPSDVELQLGRVDLSSLPGHTGWGSPGTFPDEITLLRRYLDKNHAFRHGHLPVRRHALVGDSNDPVGGRAYSASAFRSFAPMLGADNIVVARTELETPFEHRWLSWLKADTYLWTFGAGGGSNSSISTLAFRGLYNDLWAADLVNEGTNGVFHLFFGSWFGDWDQTDNLMRTALATKYGLASAWSGRPHLVFHSMGLGETLGHCIRVSQNNDGIYENQVNSFRRGIHIALMGDPTLRLHAVPPPSNFQAHTQGSDIALSWSPSAASVLGYHLYRSTEGGPWIRITYDPFYWTEFVDVGAATQSQRYMVRAIALETTPSGSYYNASQGMFASAGHSVAAAASSSTSPAVVPATMPPSHPDSLPRPAVYIPVGPPP